MKNSYYNRTVKIFNKTGLQIGKVVIYLYEPDCLDWEKCKEKGIKAFV